MVKKLIKLLLLTFIICNVVVYIYLWHKKQEVLISKPYFATMFNKVFNNKNNYEIYNFESKNINIFKGKITIFNIYKISDLSYLKNIKIIDEIKKNHININIIDIIIDENDLEKTNNLIGLSKKSTILNFILQNNINRPLFQIKKEFLLQHFNVKDNTIIIADYNLNKTINIEKENLNYNIVFNSINLIHQKTKFIKKYKSNPIMIDSFDNLLINSFDRIEYTHNFEDKVPAFFITDTLGKKIFIININGNIINMIGGGSRETGQFYDVKLCMPTTSKYYKNKLYIADFCDNSIKVANFDTTEVDNFVKNERLQNILDFEFIDDENLIISTTNGLFTYNIITKKFNNAAKNLGMVYKFMTYQNKIYFFDSTNLKMYYYSENKIQSYVDLNKIFVNHDKEIKYFFINSLGMYFVNSGTNEVWFIDNELKLHKKQFQNFGKIKDIIFFKNYLYICNDFSIKQLDLLKGGLKQIFLNFVYQNKNTLLLESNKNKQLLEKDFTIQNVSKENNYVEYNLDNSQYKILYHSPNYINLYEKEENNLNLIEQINDFRKKIEFTKLDTKKEYYIIGKIYYRIGNKSPIFIKKIKQKIIFTNDIASNLIEIAFNNYLNSSQQ